MTLSVSSRQPIEPSPKRNSTTGIFANRGPAYFTPSAPKYLSILYESQGGTLVTLSISSSHLTHLKPAPAPEDTPGGSQSGISSLLPVELSSAIYFFVTPNDPLIPLLLHRPIVLFDAKWVEACTEATQLVSLGPWIVDPLTHAPPAPNRLQPIQPTTPPGTKRKERQERLDADRNDNDPQEPYHLPSRPKKVKVAHGPVPEILSPTLLNPFLASRPKIYVDQHALLPSRAKPRRLDPNTIGEAQLSLDQSISASPIRGSPDPVRRIFDLSKHGEASSSRRHPFRPTDANRITAKSPAGKAAAKPASRKEAYKTAEEHHELSRTTQSDKHGTPACQCVPQSNSLKNWQIPTITVDHFSSDDHDHPSSPNHLAPPAQMTSQSTQPALAPAPGPPIGFGPYAKSAQHEGKAPSLPPRSTIPRFDMDDVLSAIIRLHGKVGHWEVVDWESGDGRWRIETLV